MSTGDAPRARVIPSPPKLWNGLANSPEAQLKKMKERKRREKDRGGTKERRKGQRERKEEGRQASKKDGHRLGF